jgi:hypothetical protein
MQFFRWNAQEALRFHCLKIKNQAEAWKGKIAITYRCGGVAITLNFISF